jgi:hypothetical protein
MRLKYITIAFFISFCFFKLFTLNSEAKPVVAFGYLNNISNNVNYSYLETIFPNSFASSIKSIFDVEVKKPLQIAERLKKYDKTLKRHYEFPELPEVIDKINADIFIFGNFEPLPYNQIKIELYLYIKTSNEIFSFTNVGKMETEIFKLVDRISLIVINFLDVETLYKNRRIPPGSRLAILTNIDGEDLNKLYVSFMEKGYSIVCIQNDELYNPIIGQEDFDKFKYIRTKNCSYDIITDWRKLKFYHGTWTGKEYEKAVDYVRNYYIKFDLNYSDIKNNLLENLKISLDYQIDYFLIIGFSNNKKSSWLRAIDVREKELIWMQSNIKSPLIGDPVSNIGKRIADNMEKEIRNPFEKK